MGKKSKGGSGVDKSTVLLTAKQFAPEAGVVALVDELAEQAVGLSPLDAAMDTVKKAWHDPTAKNIGEAALYVGPTSSLTAIPKYVYDVFTQDSKGDDTSPTPNSLQLGKAEWGTIEGGEEVSAGQTGRLGAPKGLPEQGKGEIERSN